MPPSILPFHEKVSQKSLKDGWSSASTGPMLQHATSHIVQSVLVDIDKNNRTRSALRIAKSTLKTRPVFHWKPHRIKAHVLLCFMTLFVERFLEFRLRQVGTPLTPDRIRHALAGIHTMVFKEKVSERIGKMESVLSEDSEKIFKVLEIPLERVTVLNGCCGVHSQTIGRGKAEKQERA